MSPARLADSIKSTTDLVVLLLAAFVTLILTICVIGVFVYAFVNPDTDLNNPLSTVLDIVTVIVGALVGFIGGRAAGIAQEKERTSNDNPG